MAAKISTRDAAKISKAIRNGENFQCHGSLSGEVAGAYVYTGKMPKTEAENLRHLVECDEVAYVVYSYVTPIAYILRDGEYIVPDARYSVTTSKHQSTIRYALSMI